MHYWFPAMPFSVYNSIGVVVLQYFTHGQLPCLHVYIGKIRVVDLPDFLLVVHLTQVAWAYKR